MTVNLEFLLVLGQHAQTISHKMNPLHPTTARMFHCEYVIDVSVDCEQALV